MTLSHCQQLKFIATTIIDWISLNNNKTKEDTNATLGIIRQIFCTMKDAEFNNVQFIP